MDSPLLSTWKERTARGLALAIAGASTTVFTTILASQLFTAWHDGRQSQMAAPLPGPVLEDIRRASLAGASTDEPGTEFTQPISVDLPDVAAF